MNALISPCHIGYPLLRFFFGCGYDSLDVSHWTLIPSIEMFTMYHHMYVLYVLVIQFLSPPQFLLCLAASAAIGANGYLKEVKGAISELRAACFPLLFIYSASQERKPLLGVMK
jgi:TRAP-type uncharacterized transport system fused permease subunit